VDKEEGDSISAATVNQSGFLKCRATGVGEDTTLSKIIKMVTDAAAEKAPVAKIADKVSGVFVPVVMCIALATALIWLFAGASIGFALQRGVCVLVISCPCALGLATPVAIMVGSGVGARKGVLFKTATALEQCGKVKTVALDKTGTITKGEGSVTDVIPMENTTREELLSIAYSLEKNSEHPIAKAIVKKGTEENIPLKETEGFEALAGSGVCGKIEKRKVLGGNCALIESAVNVPSEAKEILENLSKEGKTPVIFAREDKIFGIIAVADTLKDDSIEAIKEIKKLGINTVMLTGDNERTARTIAKRVGIDDVIAQIMPGKKEGAIRSLGKMGATCMVGDGINDAPALTKADVGIAIGAGTDIAIESADVVLSGESLGGVVTAIKLSRATLRNIHQNLFWAFFYNVIGIPLAAGMWIPITGWTLSPMFGAAAMSLSSVCVITNALRLNFFGMKKRKVKKMEMTIKIEGMMCPHCEARVKKILEETDGVTEAIVSHEKGEAIVKTDKEIPFETFKTIIEAQGYKVL
jgi:Cu2+-exporting ATPase